MDHPGKNCHRFCPYQLLNVDLFWTIVLSLFRWSWVSDWGPGHVCEGSLLFLKWFQLRQKLKSVVVFSWYVSDDRLWPIYPPGDCQEYSYTPWVTFRNIPVPRGYDHTPGWLPRIVLFPGSSIWKSTVHIGIPKKNDMRQHVSTYFTIIFPL